MKNRIFSRIDWAAFWTATVVTFFVYFFTCAPTVTLEDCGELATAGDYMGVPHPPGYPTWTVCAWFFSRALAWVGFRGQPNPAWAIAVMSAFWGALACGLMAMLVSRSANDLLRFRRKDDAPSAEETAPAARHGDLIDLAACAAGIASSLAFAFSPCMWSQSTIVEVYAFGQFFFSLVLLLTYRWMKEPSSRKIVVTAFFFGLGLTNYQVLLLAIVPLVFVILVQDIRLFRDFALFGIPFGLVCGILKLGAEYSQPGFEKHIPLDPDNPVLGSLNLFHPGWTPVTTPSGGVYYALNRVADADAAAAGTHAIYIAIIAGVVLFVVGAAALGRTALLRRQGREPVLPSWFRIASIALMAVGGICILAALGFVHAPAHNPNFDIYPKDQFFSWKLPILAFLAGMAALYVLSLFSPGGFWFAIACTGFLLPLAVLVKMGAVLGLAHPLSGYFAVYLLLNFVLLALVWLLLENGRTVALSVLAGEIGLCFYGLMPLLGDSCPPMNWGYPRTWEGFKHAVTRGQYEKISPTAMFTAEFIPKLATYFTDLRGQFTLVVAPLGFLCFAALKVRRADGRARDLLPAAVLCTGAVALLVAVDRLIPGIDLTNARLDKILMAVLLLAAGVGLHVITINQTLPLVRNALDPEKPRSERLTGGLAGIGIALAAAAAVLGFANAVAEYILEHGFSMTEAHSGYLALDYLVTAILFFAWLAGVAWFSLRSWRGQAPLTLSVGTLTERWHLMTFLCFIMMSIVLIALANPRGDIQDQFIQKVKFIQSHCLFALWIGYGIAYGLYAFLNKRKAVLLPLCAAALLLPAIPLHENFRNFKLADTISAADMHGHDFGWQFGNYQLRGAAAITEELSDDEEPLPNPCFPPEMTPDAVFFGGTDPGRFVPTYMIYSANVRPDVYLITQNALADNTYLDTMRDIQRYPRQKNPPTYADEIWMPSIIDNQRAFSQYADDVEAGRRQDLGGIVKTPDGRVSVNGALAVMEINGILTEDIFLHNRDKHDFYVEESYAIPWMYPYLTPHGLIMKLNHDRTPYSADVTTNDMDFWDWYHRRLVADPKFGREIPARKSFNKLRGSIAGTYANRHDLKRAERAYKEALALYVYSPETALRLVQEVYLPQHRFDDAVRQVELLAGLDPNNTRLPLDTLRGIRDASLLVERLSPRLREGVPLSETEALDLIDAAITAAKPLVAQDAINISMKNYPTSKTFAVKAALLLVSKGYHSEGSHLVSGPNLRLLAQPEVSDGEVLLLARALAAGNNVKDAIEAFKIYLFNRNHKDSDWEAWFDFATCYARNKDVQLALAAAGHGLSIGKEDAIRALPTKFPTLNAFLRMVEQQKQQSAAPAIGPLKSNLPK